eukprot:1099224-Rhodomonas_salina.2
MAACGLVLVGRGGCLNLWVRFRRSKRTGFSHSHKLLQSPKLAENKRRKRRVRGMNFCRGLFLELVVLDLVPGVPLGISWSNFQWELRSGGTGYMYPGYRGTPGTGVPGYNLDRVPRYPGYPGILGYPGTGPGTRSVVGP